MILGDIKRISHGLGKHKYGDVNLWGYEEPPTLDDKLEQTIRIISCRIRDVQKLQIEERENLTNMIN